MKIISRCSWLIEKADEGAQGSVTIEKCLENIGAIVYYIELQNTGVFLANING
jgi:hypothetical protein